MTRCGIRSDAFADIEAVAGGAFARTAPYLQWSLVGRGNIGAVVVDTGPRDVGAMNSFGNGRFLLVDLRGPIKIIDVETLSDAATYTETDPMLCSARAFVGALHTRRPVRERTNEQRLAPRRNGHVDRQGWYEHTTSS